MWILAVLVTCIYCDSHSREKIRSKFATKDFNGKMTLEPVGSGKILNNSLKTTWSFCNWFCFGTVVYCCIQLNAVYQNPRDWLLICSYAVCFFCVIN